MLRELFSPGVADAPVTDELLGACVRVLKDWGWAQRPAAVVSMPSRSHPQLVDSLARGIARIGRLEDLGGLDLVGEGSRGGPGGNSAYRLATCGARSGWAPSSRPVCRRWAVSPSC